MLKKNNTISGWGNFPTVNTKLTKVKSINHLIETVKRLKTVIYYGNGRSYGDSALNKRMVQCQRLSEPIDFNPETGIVHINADVLIGDLIDHILPFGWFPPVVPGTKFVTIGGAIAADIHGKNHHLEGCISQHIISFNLLLPNGDIIVCTKQNNVNLFNATCGGMGLTGIILNAKIKMRPVESRYVRQTCYKAKNIEELFSHFEKYDSNSYSVAWLDCTAKDENLGRGILMTGEFLNNKKLEKQHFAKRFKFNVPFYFPSWFLNPILLKIFNTFYFYLLSLNERKKVITDYDNFFFPLDKILNWNRLYGKHGFVQYQFVLPKENSMEGIKKILHKISSSKQGSPLAVLKLFGKKNDNYLSFPLKGYTLALDFKNHPLVNQLLDDLDKIVLENKGRVYLAKDARIKKHIFEPGYDRLSEFRKLRKKYKMDTKFQSLQSKRLGL